MSEEEPGPKLCDSHRTAIRNLARLDHIGDEDSHRAAALIAQQCPQCDPQETA